VITGQDVAITAAVCFRGLFWRHEKLEFIGGVKGPQKTNTLIVNNKHSSFLPNTFLVVVRFLNCFVCVLG